MAGSSSVSNPSFKIDIGEAKYPYPSHNFAVNIVTVKLSGKDVYDVWEQQMICLLTTHNMLGFIKDTFPSPDDGKGKAKDEDVKAWVRSNSLVKGWILGSLSEKVAVRVVNRLKQKNAGFSAKDAWDELKSIYGPRTEGDEDLIRAIFHKNFDWALDLANRHEMILHGEAVLMAIAQNFPRELSFWERRDEDKKNCRLIWKFLIFVSPFLKKRWQTYNVAKKLLAAVFAKIEKNIDSGSGSLSLPQYYTNLIFGATRLNAFEVVALIVSKHPEEIWSINEDGLTFIQYAVINRSERIYNLLYSVIRKDQDIYKRIKDPYGNNLLHLAGRLAPADKLNLISGAAFQIQRELQWFKEVEEFVGPLARIEKNDADETPKMVFTREHADLMIEGEKWMKATAESYTITAALIVTVVFTAAITVPGGNNQDTGIPIYNNNIAFTVFAVSDAISLFMAVMSLLMFLSIFTTRFSAEDFLIKLPRRLIIGFAALVISTSAMIIAFGATLFLVFGHVNSWILIPIGLLTCLPIYSSVTLQLPLIVNLTAATYGRSIFDKRKSDEYLY